MNGFASAGHFRCCCRKRRNTGQREIKKKRQRKQSPREDTKASHLVRSGGNKNAGHQRQRLNVDPRTFKPKLSNIKNTSRRSAGEIITPRPPTWPWPLRVGSHSFENRFTKGRRRWGGGQGVVKTSLDSVKLGRTLHKDCATALIVLFASVGFIVERGGGAENVISLRFHSAKLGITWCNLNKSKCAGSLVVYESFLHETLMKWESRSIERCTLVKTWPKSIETRKKGNESNPANHKRQLRMKLGWKSMDGSQPA